MKKLRLILKLVFCTMFFFGGISLYAQQNEIKAGTYYLSNPAAEYITKYKRSLKVLGIEVVKRNDEVRLFFELQTDPLPKFAQKNEKIAEKFMKKRKISKGYYLRGYKGDEIFKSFPNYYYAGLHYVNQKTNDMRDAFRHIIVQPNGDLIAYSFDSDTKTDNTRKIISIDLLSMNEDNVKSVDKEALKKIVLEMHAKIDAAFVQRKEGYENQLYKLPKAEMKDPKLEAKLLQLIKTYAKSENWKETVKRVIITYNGWAIRRNKLTGIITHKSLATVCTAKAPDGTCFFIKCSFRQDYDGSSYQKTVLNYADYYNKLKMDCKGL